MKNKYQRMDKLAKKKLYEKYMKTEIGKENMYRLYRIFAFGVFALAYGIYKIYSIIQHFKVLPLIVGIIFIIFSLVFIISYFKLRVKNFNNYELKQK